MAGPNALTTPQTFALVEVEVDHQSSKSDKMAKRLVAFLATSSAFQSPALVNKLTRKRPLLAWWNGRREDVVDHTGVTTTTTKPNNGWSAVVGAASLAFMLASAPMAAVGGDSTSSAGFEEFAAQGGTMKTDPK